jgi:anti-sigma-K factor RskA
MTGEIHALSGAYAVDALDDDEREQFERHLAECETCRAEVASLQETAALMAETTAATPPPALRGKVLAGMATVRPLPPEHPSTAVVSLDSRRRRRTTAWLAAAAAVVAIGGGGIVWSQVDDGPQSRVEQIEAAGDVQRFTVPVGDGGTATVYRSKRLNAAAIVTKGMPAAPSDHAYALWLQHGDVMVPAGIMPAGADNEVVLSGDAATADGAGITIEDAGTEPTQPSDDVVALVSFDA